MIPYMADLLSTAQAATRLKVSKSTVIYRARLGQLPYEQKLPGETGAYLFSQEVIDAAAEADASAAQQISA